MAVISCMKPNEARAEYLKSIPNLSHGSFRLVYHISLAYVPFALLGMICG
jgi:hypothetical protein